MKPKGVDGTMIRFVFFFMFSATKMRMYELSAQFWVVSALRDYL